MVKHIYKIYLLIFLAIDIHHHTPNRSLSINLSHCDYSPSTERFIHSPTTLFQSSTSSPKQIPNNLNEKYRNKIFIIKIIIKYFL
jgi:hypothetical protein